MEINGLRKPINPAEWRSLKPKLLILLGLWLLSFYPVYPYLVQTWLNHSDNSHGILVPFVTLFFIWQKKEELVTARISNSNWGAVLLIISLGIYLLSYAGGIAVVSRSMIVLSLMGIVLFIFGKEIFSILTFPLLFLLFMVPIPDSLLNLVSFPLQMYATKIAYVLINFFSIPVYREGNMLYFAQTQLEVAEACSGIRSIISFFMLSAIFTYMLNKGKTRKIVLLASAIPLALFMNIIRITGTGILAHFYGSKIALGFLHEFSGLLIFGIGFILLFCEYLIFSKNN
jgi:exosortase A